MSQVPQTTPVVTNTNTNTIPAVITPTSTLPQTPNQQGQQSTLPATNATLDNAKPLREDFQAKLALYTKKRTGGSTIANPTPTPTPTTNPAPVSAPVQQPLSKAPNGQVANQQPTNNPQDPNTNTNTTIDQKVGGGDETQNNIYGKYDAAGRMKTFDLDMDASAISDMLEVPIEVSGSLPPVLKQPLMKLNANLESLMGQYSDLNNTAQELDTENEQLHTLMTKADEFRSEVETEDAAIWKHVHERLYEKRRKEGAEFQQNYTFPDTLPGLIDMLITDIETRDALVDKVTKDFNNSMTRSNGMKAFKDIAGRGTVQQGQQQGQQQPPPQQRQQQQQQQQRSNGRGGGQQQQQQQQQQKPYDRPPERSNRLQQFTNAISRGTNFMFPNGNNHPTNGGRQQEVRVGHSAPQGEMEFDNSIPFLEKLDPRGGGIDPNRFAREMEEHQASLNENHGRSSFDIKAPSFIDPTGTELPHFNQSEGRRWRR